MTQTGSPVADPLPTEPWLVFAESSRGSAHVAMGLPNQDSYLTSALEIGADQAVVVAVADGHGNRRHFRSDSGSRFAVTAACECVAAAAELLGPSTSMPAIEAVAKDTIIPAILEQWRSMVADDVASKPFTEAEDALRAQGDRPDVAYGSTLILAIWAPRWVLCIQIGDGDVVAVQPDGSALLPVPADPRLDGHRTTSLCQVTALDAFRYGSVDRTKSPPLGLLLATDGYGNSQVADPWQPVVSADLAELLEEHGAVWVGGQLREWTERCASPDGSGDDTTVALILEPDERRGRVAPRNRRARWLWLTTSGVVLLLAVAAAVLFVVSSNDASKNPGKVKSPAHTSSVAVRNPLTGAKISVPLPPQVQIGPYVQEGKSLFVLSDDRVWRITITDPREVSSSGRLESSGPPMTGTAATITVSGFGGKVRYLVDTKSLQVKCVPTGAQGTSVDLCPGAGTTSSVS